jgi:hypothetical protein
MNSFRRSGQSLAAATLTILLTSCALPAAAQQPAPFPIAQRSGDSSKASQSDAPVTLTLSALRNEQARHSHTHAGGVSLASLIEAAIAANPEITAMKREFDAARAHSASEGVARPDGFAQQ